MIRITDKSRCSGCSACYSVCPMNAIVMKQDELGFRYPQVIEDKCISCSLCETVCPYGRQYEPSADVDVFAAINKDDSIRSESSSGGVFHVLASEVLAEGGSVYGAAFSDGYDSVEHVCVDNQASLGRLHGSKYVQSDLNDVFSKVRSDLKDERPVLFSGTPCQVAGLNSFLGKRYDKLLSVACACHGVPSPEVWRCYYHELKGDSDHVTFRDKSHGWKNYQVRIGDYSSPAFSDPYMKAMLKGITLRPSCLECAFKGKNCGCDILLGDWWGIGRICAELDDDKGTGAVLVFSEQGRKYLNEDLLKLRKMNSLDDPGNGGFNIKKFKPSGIEKISDALVRGERIYKVLKDMTEASLYEKIVRRINKVFKR